MHNDQAPGALVLGLTANGVGVLHSLRSLSPVPKPIVGIDSNSRAIGFTSGVGRKMVGPPPWERGGGSLRDLLITVAEKVGYRLVLYPTSDDYVRFVSDHREELAPYYLFLVPKREILDKLLNKARFARLAKDLKIPSPKSTVIEATPKVKLPRGFRYPVVVKPLTTYKSNPMRKVMKVLEFNSPEEWDRFFDPWRNSGYKVLVQEKIIGNDNDVYFYGGLWNKDGKPLLAFTGRKLRQLPKRYGSTSMAVCQLEPEVKVQSEMLLSAIGYEGLVDVEFKRDARDGQLRVIEINARQGLWHRVGRTCGVDLIQNLYRLLSGDPTSTTRQTPTARGHWCYFSRDLRRLKQDIRGGFWPVTAWIRSYFGFPTEALFYWKDPKPFLVDLYRLFVKQSSHTNVPNKISNNKEVLQLTPFENTGSK